MLNFVNYYVISMLFCCIVQIGVAVGDIEKVQRNAYLKRIGLQVGLSHPTVRLERPVNWRGTYIHCRCDDQV